MKEGTSPEVLKARESRGEPRVGRVRGSGPCRGVIERPGRSRHDSNQLLSADPVPAYAVKCVPRESPTVVTDESNVNVGVVRWW